MTTRPGSGRAAVIDEETPLLADSHDNDHNDPSRKTKKKITPLPWFQFSLVLLLQLAEPLTSNVIYPFAPQLIREIGITNGDETKVGYYVGLMQSLFFLTQAFTVLHWSRISDRVGRKPVILSGLFGLSVSMYCFGLSSTFWGLVLSRSLNGALNGNIGVIKSMMAEMTDSTNIATAYAYMPIAWSTGGTLGPVIGGSLSKPVERFPHLFGNNEFLKKYPYFLPCAVPATYTALAWLVTYFFLKETVTAPVSYWQLFKGWFRSEKQKKLEDEDSRSLLGVHDDGDCRILDSSAATSSSTPVPPPTITEKPLPLRQLLTPNVLIAASNYAFLSLVDIAYRAIQPVFFSTPIALGGLGLPPSTIGNILSAFGVLNGVFQVMFFARIHDRWGAKRTFVLGIAAGAPVFVMFPVMSFLARMGESGSVVGGAGAGAGLSWMVWTAVAVQVVVSILISVSYGAIFIFISAASPNRASLGATNGLSQMSVSVMRAIGPALANSLFSLSIERNYLGGWLVYYILLLIVAISLFVASLLPDEV
ncbi:hypothetical protein AX16_010131 [Volvariella volvacea WC 439]|nr:hypothetical protein AX16_010131 [Volvariella volvacea WC 439]